MDVTIGCRCPGTPHESDTVTLHEPMEPRTRRALLYDVGLLDEPTPGDEFAVLSEGYVLRCIDRWTLVGEAGKPLPPSRAAIRDRIIADPRTYDTVARAADDLYSEAVLLPLMAGASSSLRPTRTAGRTSATTAGATPHPRRSRRSSTPTIPTVVTGPMQASSGGGSSTSPR